MMINLKTVSIFQEVVVEALLHSNNSSSTYRNKKMSRTWAAQRVLFPGDLLPVIINSISLGCLISRVSFNRRAGRRWPYHPRSSVATLSSRVESAPWVMAAQKYLPHHMAQLVTIHSRGLPLLLSFSCRHNIASNSLGITVWNRDQLQRGEHYQQIRHPRLSPPRFPSCLSNLTKPKRWWWNKHLSQRRQSSWMTTCSSTGPTLSRNVAI